MKAPLLTLVLVASSAPFLVAGEVGPGSSLDEVRTTLGVPNGQLRLGDRHLLYYERGEVELQNGRVARVALRSPEEHAVLVSRQERMHAEREIQRSRLFAEGTALRDRKLTDAAFLAAPVAYQVAFWESFTRSYPGVSCVEPLTVARLRLNDQLEQKRRQEESANRIAELEERLAVAERPAAFYPISTYPSYYGRRHHYQDFGLGQITYTFYDSGLTPYSTPSGNPAGSLTGAVIDLPATNQALPGWERAERSNRDHWKRQERDGRPDWRGAERGRRHSRDRM